MNAMVDAAKRWIKFDIPDSVKLGMVLFAEETHVIPFQDMTEITDASRDELVAKVGEIYDMTGARTCIGCGLALAANGPQFLNGGRGGNILLITDGVQLCYSDGPECTTVSEMADILVERNVRVVTIAMGPEADPEIEELAEKTGGKSYYVEVNLIIHFRVV